MVEVQCLALWFKLNTRELKELVPWRATVAVGFKFNNDAMVVEGYCDSGVQVCLKYYEKYEQIESKQTMFRGLDSPRHLKEVRIEMPIKTIPYLVYFELPLFMACIC